MTIGLPPSRVSFNCDGSSKVFPVPLQAYLGTDFTVMLAAPVSAGGGETILTLNSDYSLATNSTDQPPKWVLTTLAASAYASGYTLQVFVNPLLEQQTQYVQGQAFPSLAVQANMDRLTQMVQRLQDQVSRSIRAPDGDNSPLMLLPNAANRLNQALMLDSNGNIALGVPNTQVITTGLLAPFLELQQTAAEAAAGVTPVNYAYAPGDVRRYGAVLDGTTNDRGALASAISVASTNAFTIVIDGPMAIATSITIPANVTIQFIGNGALKAATGQTITFNGTVIAQPNQAIFSNALSGQGTVAFSTNKQRWFYFEWWGAKGDSVTDDSAPMQACLTQASNAQGTIYLVGNYAFATALVIPTAVEMIGFGKDFGTQLTPTGSANISYTGSSFKCALRRVVIESGQTTAVSTVVCNGGVYNLVFEDIFLHGMNIQTANVCGFNLTSCQDITLNRVTVYGNGGGSSDCFLIGNAARVKLICPDPEASFHGIKVTGTGQCDIISPYIERCSGYGIYLDRTGAGQVTIVGGDIEVPNAGGTAIGIAGTASNITIAGTPNIVLNGGTGIAPVGSGPFTNILVLNPPAASMSDPSNLLGVFTAGAPTTGAATPSLGSNKPGSNSSVALWVPEVHNGVTYYRPLWT